MANQLILIIIDGSRNEFIYLVGEGNMFIILSTY